jgi:SAM-dependent methyltransferase
LEQEQLEGGPFDLIVSVCYLWRPLFAEYPRLLNAGGTLVVVQPTLKNLERNDKPPAAYLLNEGELPRRQRREAARAAAPRRTRSDTTASRSRRR